MGAIGDIFIRAASDEERIEDTARLEEEEKEREEREQKLKWMRQYCAFYDMDDYIVDSSTGYTRKKKK